MVRVDFSVRCGARSSTPLFGAVRTVLCAMVLAALPNWGAFAQTASVSRTESLGAWQKVASVLQHPRCLNCHQANIPLQGDKGRLHMPLVERGAGNFGVGAMTCANCHNAMGNNETSRTPGAPHWTLAPLPMKWQGLTTGQLCRQLKDLKRNGNRDPEAIVKHMETDELVLWGWKPGAGLQPVQMPHDEFVRHLRTWVAGGTACPA